MFKTAGFFKTNGHRPGHRPGHRASAPKVTETPQSFSPQPSEPEPPLAGSAQSRSHRSPDSGTAQGLERLTNLPWKKWRLHGGIFRIHGEFNVIEWGFDGE